MLALPVVVGGDIGLGVAGGDFVEGVEGADALACGEVLHCELAVCQLLDPRRQALGRNTEPGKIAWPGGNDGHFLHGLCHRWRRQFSLFFRNLFF